MDENSELSPVTTPLQVVEDPGKLSLVDVAGYLAFVAQCVLVAMQFLGSLHPNFVDVAVETVAIALAAGFGCYGLRKSQRVSWPRLFSLSGVVVGVLAVGFSLVGIVSDFERISLAWEWYLSR